MTSNEQVDRASSSAISAPMKTKDELLAFLERIGSAPETLEHRAVFRVGEGEDVKSGLPGAHTKNLFLKDAKGRLWLISAKDSTAIDLKRLPGVIGAARLSFGSAELLERVLGVTPGSVTALALVNDAARQVTFVLDAALARAERVNFHPLVNTATTGLSAAGFHGFLEAVGVKPIVVDFETLTRADAEEAR